MSRIILTKDNCKITQTDLYLIKLEMADGTIYEELEPRRLFPHTDLDHYITIIDENENEIALIKDINDVDKGSREAILSCFDGFYMIPKINQVVGVQDKFGALKLSVMTERGYVEFRIRNRHSDMKTYPGDRVIIRDSNDNRYEIENLNNLDRKSWLLVASFL